MSQNVGSQLYKWLDARHIDYTFIFIGAGETDISYAIKKAVGVTLVLGTPKAERLVTMIYGYSYEPPPRLYWNYPPLYLVYTDRGSRVWCRRGRHVLC